jgi:hypothetical protein
MYLSRASTPQPAATGQVRASSSQLAKATKLRSGQQNAFGKFFRKAQKALQGSMSPLEVRACRLKGGRLTRAQTADMHSTYVLLTAHSYV